MVEIDKEIEKGTENGNGLSLRLRHSARCQTHGGTAKALGSSEGGVELINKLRNERKAMTLRADSRVFVSVVEEGQGVLVHCRCDYLC
ncbi:hypothetical protein CDL15_Pgr017350 [Punica granatum]|uniref:Uncharacterized protein n=1 Tax=Punica granatum TaxID=22663 RepID=A0A218Y4H6_PUNGR|nr:hypothetical protein CDL15_Pgr017350 [Punica granatum]